MIHSSRCKNKAGFLPISPSTSLLHPGHHTPFQQLLSQLTSVLWVEREVGMSPLPWRCILGMSYHCFGLQQASFMLLLSSAGRGERVFCSLGSVLLGPCQATANSRCCRLDTSAQKQMVLPERVHSGVYSIVETARHASRLDLQAHTTCTADSSLFLY